MRRAPQRPNASWPKRRSSRHWPRRCTTPAATIRRHSCKSPSKASRNTGANTRSVASNWPKRKFWLCSRTAADRSFSPALPAVCAARPTSRRSHPRRRHSAISRRALREGMGRRTQACTHLRHLDLAPAERSFVGVLEHEQRVPRGLRPVPQHLRSRQPVLEHWIMRNKRRTSSGQLQARLAERILTHAKVQGFAVGAWLSENALAQALRCDGHGWCFRLRSRFGS